MSGSDPVAELADELGYDPEADAWAVSGRVWLTHYLAVGLDRLAVTPREGAGERKAERVVGAIEDLNGKYSSAVAGQVDYREAFKTVAEMLRTLSSEANEAHDSEDERRSGLHAGIGYITATCETACTAPAVVTGRGLDGFRDTVRLIGSPGTEASEKDDDG